MRSRLTISVSLFIGVFGLGACTEGTSLAPTDPDPSEVVVTAVTVTPSRDTIVIGNTVRLSARVTTTDNMTPPATAWRSTAPNIADVSDGLVRGVAAGWTKVLAQAGEVVDTADIWVIPPPPAPVASVTVTPAAVSVVVGANVQLSVILKDAAGTVLTGRSVSWSSSSSSVATVSGTGLVAAVASGSAAITATSEGRSASSTVTITSVAAPVASVVVSPASASVQIGQTLQLAATPRDASGTALGGRTITWTSSNTSAAAVNSGGLVTGTGLGTATITATSEGQSGSSTITMTSPPAPVASVEVTPATANLVGAQTVQLATVLKDATGAVLTGRTVTWASSNTNIATVSSSGLVTGRGVGTATITAASEGKSGTATITGSLVPVASVSVTPATASLDVGRSMQLTATPRDASNTALTGRTITWTSSNTAVVAVNGSGLIIGTGPGTAQVTATCDGKSASATLTVTTAPVPPAGSPCTQSWPSAVYAPMPASTGQAFYVSPAGSDANPGTLDAPWKTLQKAFDALQPGQIAFLRAGTYGAKCASTTFSRAGTATAPITVQGYPGERAVLNGQVRLDGSYFRLSRIVMEGPTCGAWGGSGQLGENMILMTPGKTHHVEVSHSEVFHGGWHAGISAGGDDIWVLNNYIHDNGNFNDGSQYNTSHGIYYHDGTRGVVANNILEHNFAKGLSARFSANHIMVINNTVVGNGRSGMDIAEDTHDWTFANNIVMNNGNVNDGVGINTGGSSGDATHLLINNVFWNNGDSGTSNWNDNATRVNNLVANPLLVNPTNSTPGTSHVAYTNDYRLNAGSPAIGFASMIYALPLDVTGVCRLQDDRADAGAVERTP